MKKSGIRYGVILVNIGTALAEKGLKQDAGLAGPDLQAIFNPSKYPDEDMVWIGGLRCIFAL